MQCTAQYVLLALIRWIAIYPLVSVIRPDEGPRPSTEYKPWDKHLKRPKRTTNDKTLAIVISQDEITPKFEFTCYIL